MWNSKWKRRISQNGIQVSKAIAETLESRTLLSLSASAQLSLVSTTGTAGAPIFNYSIELKNTGTTNVGAFWFAWVPGADFLPSQPLSETGPSGWSANLTGTHNSTDGTAVQWVAGSSAVALAAGGTLDGFTFRRFLSELPEFAMRC